MKLGGEVYDEANISHLSVSMEEGGGLDESKLTAQKKRSVCPYSE